jgi:L,D-peptidoglycan transpeptidase YkuD (ErfK/YbiS/YcfS/YnhG family)
VALVLLCAGSSMLAPTVATAATRHRGEPPGEAGPRGVGPQATHRSTPVWRGFLPYRMAYIPAGTTELITVRARHHSSRTAQLDFWYKNPGDHWRLYLTSDARVGANGLVKGSRRVQLSDTTPIGIYAVPYAFGTVGKASFPGIHYRPITHKSYFCEDNASRYYNRWVEQYPMTVCRPSESEHLIDFAVYRRAFLIEYNWGQVRHRGAGIFLHEDGASWTAGCVSTDAVTMARLGRHVHGTARPNIAIGLYGRSIENL